MAKRRRIFSPEFKLRSAQLVVDQGYTVQAVCDAVGVGKSTMEYWVRQLRQERQGETPKTSAITPGQCRIQELEKQLRRVEEEKEILKNTRKFACVNNECRTSQFSSVLNVAIQNAQNPLRCLASIRQWCTLNFKSGVAYDPMLAIIGENYETT